MTHKSHLTRTTPQNLISIHFYSIIIPVLGGGFAKSLISNILVNIIPYIVYEYKYLSLYIYTHTVHVYIDTVYTCVYRFAIFIPRGIRWHEICIGIRDLSSRKGPKERKLHLIKLLINRGGEAGREREEERDRPKQRNVKKKRMTLFTIPPTPASKQAARN